VLHASQRNRQGSPARAAIVGVGHPEARILAALIGDQKKLLRGEERWGGFRRVDVVDTACCYCMRKRDPLGESTDGAGARRICETSKFFPGCVSSYKKSAPMIVCAIPAGDRTRSADERNL